jgi:ribonuclease Z
MRSRNCRFSTVEAILITHLHGDHFFGIFGLLASLSSNKRTEPVTVVGPVGIATTLRSVLTHSGTGLRYPIYIYEVPDVETTNLDPYFERKCLLVSSHTSPRIPTRSLMFSYVSSLSHPFPPPLSFAPASPHADLGIRVRSVPLQHRVPTVGYVVEEYARPGKLDGARAKALGVPSGKLMGELKAGRAVTLPDGTVIEPTAVLSAPIPGRKIAFLQDTHDASAAVPDCAGASLMVHECTYDAGVSVETAVERGHSTSVMAAATAAAAGADTLILTHFSSRYTRETLIKKDDGTVLFSELPPTITIAAANATVTALAAAAEAAAAEAAIAGAAATAETVGSVASPMADTESAVCPADTATAAVATACASTGAGAGACGSRCSGSKASSAAAGNDDDAGADFAGARPAFGTLGVTDLKLQAEAEIARRGASTTVEVAADFRVFEMRGIRWVPLPEADVTADLLM